MGDCINFGSNCIGCGYEYCIDSRKCFGMCGGCINSDCDNHPQNEKNPLSFSATQTRYTPDLKNRHTQNRRNHHDYDKEVPIYNTPSG